MPNLAYTRFLVTDLLMLTFAGRRPTINGQAWMTTTQVAKAPAAEDITRLEDAKEYPCSLSGLPHGMTADPSTPWS